MYKVLFVDDEKKSTSGNACKSENDLDEKNEAFAVAILDVSENLLKTRKDEIDEILAGIVKKAYNLHYLCATMDDEIAIVMSSAKKEMFERTAFYPYLEEIRKKFAKFLSAEVCMGISTVGASRREIKIKYLECKRALEHKMYIKNASTIFFDDIGNGSVPEPEQFFGGGLTLSNNIVDCVFSGDEKQMDILLDEFALFSKSIAEPEKVKDLCMALILRIYGSLKTINEGVGSIKARRAAEAAMEKSRTAEEAVEVMSEAARDTVKKFYDYNNTLFGVTLKKAVAYISQNFEKLLTRDDIAKAVGVTPNYVSVLFRKGFDMTFVEYLTNLRISEAKKLLENTDKKIYQIAEAVGFDDAYYFSKNFKNVIGMSPKEYRIKMQSR